MRKIHKEREDRHGEIQRDLEVTVAFRISSLLHAQVWGGGTSKGGQRPAGTSSIAGDPHGQPCRK